MCNTYANVCMHMIWNNTEIIKIIPSGLGFGLEYWLIERIDVDTHAKIGVSYAYA